MQAASISISMLSPRTPCPNGISDNQAATDVPSFAEVFVGKLSTVATGGPNEAHLESDGSTSTVKLVRSPSAKSLVTRSRPKSSNTTGNNNSESPSSSTTTAAKTFTITLDPNPNVPTPVEDVATAAQETQNETSSARIDAVDMRSAASTALAASNTALPAQAVPISVEEPSGEKRRMAPEPQAQRNSPTEPNAGPADSAPIVSELDVNAADTPRKDQPQATATDLQTGTLVEVAPDSVQSDVSGEHSAVVSTRAISTNDAPPSPTAPPDMPMAQSSGGTQNIGPAKSTDAPQTPALTMEAITMATAEVSADVVTADQTASSPNGLPVAAYLSSTAFSEGHSSSPSRVAVSISIPVSHIAVAAAAARKVPATEHDNNVDMSVRLSEPAPRPGQPAARDDLSPTVHDLRASAASIAASPSQTEAVAIKNVLVVANTNDSAQPVVGAPAVRETNTIPPNSHTQPQENAKQGGDQLPATSTDPTGNIDDDGGTDQHSDLADFSSDSEPSRSAPVVSISVGVPAKVQTITSPTPDPQNGASNVVSPAANEHAVTQATAKLSSGDNVSGDAQRPTQAPPQNLVGAESSGTSSVTTAHIADHVTQSEIHVAMQAEKLGPVELHARVTGEQVGANIVVERKEAHEALAVELSSLRQALTEKNLRVEHVWLTQTASHATAGDAGNSADRRPHSQSQPLSRFTNNESSVPRSVPSVTAETSEIFDEQGRLSVRA